MGVQGMLIGLNWGDGAEALPAARVLRMLETWLAAVLREHGVRAAAAGRERLLGVGFTSVPWRYRLSRRKNLPGGWPTGRAMIPTAVAHAVVLNGSDGALCGARIVSYEADGVWPMTESRRCDACTALAYEADQAF